MQHAVQLILNNQNKEDGRKDQIQDSQVLPVVQEKILCDAGTDKKAILQKMRAFGV